MSSITSARSPHVPSAPSFESEGRAFALLQRCRRAASDCLPCGLVQAERGCPLFCLPHAYCFLGSRGLIWSHVISDSLIGISYFAISGTLAYLVYRGRREMPFHWRFLAFGLFIVACGLTHLVDVVTVWIPVYVISAGMKGFTAVVSLGTAIVLPFIVPQILLMIQSAKESPELRRMNELLEVRVRERVLDLAVANEGLMTSERQYRLLFESNPMPMWVFERHSLKFLAVNEAAIRHYGYSRDELLSMTIADIRPERAFQC